MILLLALTKHQLRFKNQITRSMQTETIQEEPLPIVPENPLENKTVTTKLPAWKNTLKDLKEKYKDLLQQGEKTTSSITDSESNQQDTVFPEKQQFYIPPIINKEVLLADLTVKTISGNLDEVNDRLNLQIKKSEELAKEWTEQIKKLEAYTESLKTIQWKKMLTYSICTLTVLAFLWKMVSLRSIPNFLGNLGGFLLDSSTSGNVSDYNIPSPSNIPKPSMDSIKLFMESPITPVAFVASVGSVTLVVGTLKLIVWVLRKAK